MKWFNWFYNKHVYYLTETDAMTFPKSEPSSRWNPKGITIKVADEDDFTRLASRSDKFRLSTRIEDRIRHGDRCVVAYVDGRLAHFRWLASTDPEVPFVGSRLTMHLESDEAYTYDSYTFPEYRRRGISQESRRFLVIDAAQQGIMKLYSLARVDNPHSRTRAQRERQGRAQTIGTITIITRFGSRKYQFQGRTAANCTTIAKLFRVPVDQIQPLQPYYVKGCFQLVVPSTSSV